MCLVLIEGKTGAGPVSHLFSWGWGCCMEIPGPEVKVNRTRACLGMTGLLKWGLAVGSGDPRSSWTGAALRVCIHWPPSVQFSHSVLSDSFRPHESQHARPPCPSPTPSIIIQTHVHRVGDAMQPSRPLSSPSPPAPNPSQHQSLFQ